MFSITDLKDISITKHQSFIILGDFNAWSILWGSNTTNIKGKIIENLIYNENLIVLNDGTYTHLSTHNSLTNVDIAMCNAQLAPYVSWSVTNSLYASDHFPILIKVGIYSNQNKYKPFPKYKLDGANWGKFQMRCTEQNRRCNYSRNINSEAARIVKIIRFAANTSISQTKHSYMKKSIRWWNNSLIILRKDKQQKWHKYIRNRSDENLLAYKKANAIFKKNIKLSKAESLSNSHLRLTRILALKKYGTI